MRFKALLLLLIYLSAITFSCDEESINEPDGNNEQTPNIENPTDNTGVVVLERIHGEADSNSEIHEMEPDSQRGFYFRGIKRGRSVVGKLSNAGEIIWTSEIVGEAKGIEAVSVGNNDMLLVSTYSGTGKGTVFLFSSDGNRLSTLIFDEYPITIINDIHLLTSDAAYNDEEFVFVAIGGAGNSQSTISPYISHFVLNTNNQSIGFSHTDNISFDKQSVVFTEYSNFSFERAPDGNTSFRCAPTCSGSEVYLIGEEVSSDPNSKTVGLAKIDKRYFLGDNDGFLQILEPKLDWIRTVSFTSTGNIQNVTSGVGTYLLLSQATDVGKEDPPTSNTGVNLWDGIRIIRYDLDGKMQYDAKLPISISHDRIHDAWYEGATFGSGDTGSLIICGTASLYYQEGKRLGYGMIGKVDAESGVLLSYKLLGSQLEESALYSISEVDNRVFMGGYTNYVDQEQKSNMWFLEVDIDNL